MLSSNKYLFETLGNKYPENKYLFIGKPTHIEMSSGIKVSKEGIKKKIKTFGKKSLNALNKFGKWSAKNKEKVIDLLANPAVNQLIESIPVVGDTLSTVIKTGKTVKDTLKKYENKEKPLTPENVITDVKDTYKQLKEDKNINDLIENMKKRIKGEPKLTDKEKEELIENSNDINLQSKASGLEYAMFIPKSKRSGKIMTIPKKYRDMFDIKKKTFTAKDVFKDSGRLALGVKTDKKKEKKTEGCGKMSKDEILKLMTS